MNGVAQLAAHAGYNVSGSDRASGLEIFTILKQKGIAIVPQDGSGITNKTDFVVYSTAIESDNPDIKKAESLGIPLLHRAEMLAKLCEDKEIVAVAGTAGKSTVTGLLGHIFEQLGNDPTVYCGAAINNFGSSVRFGSGNGPWIIEADESDKSFLNFHPDHAIITNVAEDHFELSELRKLFAQFESQVSGSVIKQPESFDVPSPLLGKHNVENINNALTLCRELKLNIDQCRNAVASFKGIERRLERVGDKVIDDFAHSPIKIEAALKAASEVWATFNTVWRPHGFTPLAQGLDGFINAFSSGKAQGVFILPVYYAGGTVEKKISSEQFVEKLQAAGVPAEYVGNFQVLEKYLCEDNHPVLLMGARDSELPKFARRLASKLGK